MGDVESQDEDYETISNKKITWIALKSPTREKMNKLGKIYSFHELNIEDSLSIIQFSKVDRYEDHFFAILHFPTIDKRLGIPRSSQLSIFGGSNYLVTVQKAELQPLTEMFQICKADPRARESFLGNSTMTMSALKEKGKFHIC